MKKLLAALAVTALTATAAFTAAPAHAAPAPDTDYPITFDGNPSIHGTFRVQNCDRIRIDLEVPTRDHLFTRVEGRAAGEQNQIFHEIDRRAAAFTIPTVQHGWNKIEIRNQHGVRLGHAVAWNPCR